MTKADALVIIIDDDPDVREALVGLLDTVGLATQTLSDADSYFEKAPHSGPCCLVLDVRLPGLGGLEFQRRLAQDNIQVPIIFVTGYGDVPMSVRAMKAGAVEFLTKPINEQQFLEAVQTALRRDEMRLEAERGVAVLQERFGTLTGRERQVMELLVAGLANKQVAGELDISEVTVRLHRVQVMRKMQVRSLAELIRVADKIERHLRIAPAP